MIVRDFCIMDSGSTLTRRRQSRKVEAMGSDEKTTDLNSKVLTSGQRIQRTSLVDLVYETLVEAIVSGTLPSGTELNTVDLSQQLDVSRTPVKEAIKLLLRDGLIEQVNNHKAKVVQFSREDVIEIYEVRKILESTSAELAAKFIDDETLKLLRKELNGLLRNRDDVDWSTKVREFDIEFHDALAIASKNRRLRADVARYRLLVRSFCRMTGKTSVLIDALKEHLEIVKAIETRRPAAARKAMARHIQSRAETVLVQLFDEQNEC